MRRVERKGNAVIFRQYPAILWIGAVVIAVVIALSGMGRTDVIGYGVSFALAVAIVILSQWHFTATIVRVSPQTRTVSVRRQAMIRYEFEVFDFDDLKSHFYIRRSSTSRGERVDLMLEIRSKGPIKIASPTTYGEEWVDVRLVDVAAMLNGAIPEFAARDDVKTLPIP